MKGLSKNPTYDVFICTSPFPDNTTCASDKMIWIEKHLGKEFVNKIVITFDKTIVDAEFLIDDKEHIKGANGKPSFLHILKRCGHNFGVFGSGMKPVLEEWSDLDGILNKYKRG